MSVVELVALSLFVEEIIGCAPLIELDVKRPTRPRWQEGPREDPERWRAYLAHHRGNVGLLTGRLRNGWYLVVLDLDYYKPGARDFAEELFARGLPRYTVTVLTPSGGEHLYFLSPVPIPSVTLAPGVEIKCEGRQVAIPPSIGANGKPYEHEYGYALAEHEIVELEAQHVDILGGPEVRAARASSNGADDDANARTLRVLEAHYGGHSARWNGRYWTLTRPGKDERDGHSATIGEVAPGVAHVFSDSWPPLDADGTYNVHELYKLRGIPDPLDERMKALSARIVAREAPSMRARTLVDLMNDTPADHDWVIRDLIERGDRAMFTAPGGGGKSTLLRQIACSAALGCNPFGDPPFVPSFDPIRSLIVDCENSERQMRREFERVRTIVGPERFDRLAPLVHYASRTGGLVLDKDRGDGAVDREWLEEIIAATKPDLVAIGPLYKMQGGKPNDEDGARDCVKWIDHLRVTYAFAIVVEAHTAKAEGATKPAGSDVWSRWAEFGYFLSPSGEFRRWRGDREERSWPTHFVTRGEHNDVTEGRWFWTPTNTIEPHSTRADRVEDQIATAELAVLRASRGFGKPATRGELAEYTGLSRSSAYAAIMRLLVRKILRVVAREDRPNASGATQSVEVLDIAPESGMR